MLLAADVQIDRHVFVSGVSAERLRRVARVEIAQVVPGRVYERVHGVSLSPRVVILTSGDTAHRHKHIAKIKANYAVPVFFLTERGGHRMTRTCAKPE